MVSGVELGAWRHVGLEQRCDDYDQLCVASRSPKFIPEVTNWSPDLKFILLFLFFCLLLIY